MGAIIMDLLLSAGEDELPGPSAPQEVAYKCGGLSSPHRV